jgi:hypothetical protein
MATARRRLLNPVEAAMFAAPEARRRRVGYNSVATIVENARAAQQPARLPLQVRSDFLPPDR